MNQLETCFKNQPTLSYYNQLQVICLVGTERAKSKQYLLEVSPTVRANAELRLTGRDWLGEMEKSSPQIHRLAPVHVEDASGSILLN